MVNPKKFKDRVTNILGATDYLALDFGSSNDH